MASFTLQRLISKYQAKQLGLKRLLLDIQAQEGVLRQSDVDALVKDYGINRFELEHWIRITRSLSVVQDSQHYVSFCVGMTCGHPDYDGFRMSIFDYAQKHPNTLQVALIPCMGLCGLGPNGIVDGKVVNDIVHNQPFKEFIKSLMEN